ncbi:MAG: hypothetical protein ILA34_07200 [Bacteroidaceae bacterium]|nr:hypothetical protein [Bacteroidaceae bacterium]
MMKKTIYLLLLTLAWGKALAQDSNIYRFDDMGTGLQQNTFFDGGYGLMDMGDNDYSIYGLGKFTRMSAKKCFITRDMAIENWGAKYNYTFEATEDMDVNISIKHFVPWDGWARHSNHDNNTRNQYVIEDASELDWVSRYYAAMILSLDNQNLPTAQQSRPLAPADYEADGATYNKILADKNLWKSTLVESQPNDTLWLYPKAGGDNSRQPYYNDIPEYIKVHLTKGPHTFTVTSLCSGWDFDCLQLEDWTISSIAAVKEKEGFRAWSNNGIIYAGHGEEIRLYNSQGELISTFRQQTTVPRGIYILKSGKAVQKIFVR